MGNQSAVRSVREELDGVGTRHFEGAYVQPNRGIAATEYNVTGELSAVLKAAQSILETYPGLGYGTYIKHMTQLSDGSYGCIITRSNSCD